MRMKTLLLVLTTCVALVAVGGIVNAAQEEDARWQYRYGDAGSNTLLPFYIADFGGGWSPGPGLSAWATDETWQDSYVLKNNTGKAQTWSDNSYHPVDSVCVGPAADDDAVIAWLCPYDDTINITAEFEFRQDHAGRNGIDYYVYKKTSKKKTSETLLSGSLDGSLGLGSSTGTLTANNVSVTAGDRIEFGVGSMGDPAYDVTRVYGTITGGTESWDLEADYITGEGSEPTKWINPDATAATLPSYSGTSYSRTVPDTFDIQVMADRAVDGMIAMTDSDADHEIYWRCELLTRNPPTAYHDWSDSVQSKWVNDMPLCRMVSGNMAGKSTVEQGWADQIFLMQHVDDGLYYYGKTDVPWHTLNVYGAEAPGDYYAIMYPNGRYISAATAYYNLTSDSRWTTSGKDCVDGLSALANIKSGAASWDWLMFSPGGEYDDSEDQNHNLSAWFAWIIPGCCDLYDATGYVPAQTLAGQVSKWIKTKSGSFNSNGTWNIESKAYGLTHFHGHSMCLVSISQYILSSGDTTYLDWVEDCYLYGRDYSTSNALTGYFAEHLELANDTCETCCTADMLTVAIRLSQAGAGDYWDDADRWIRNQFCESQMVSGDWVAAAVKGLPVTGAAYNETQTNVATRLEGNFTTEGRGNDIVKGGTGGGFLGCCMGNACRTIYWIWDAIITYDSGDLDVNLLMNRASPYADIDSYIPYEGRVVVDMKQACTSLDIRIPEWCSTGDITVKVNGTPQSVTFNGRYAQVGSVGATDDVEMTFPISETTHNGEIMGGVSYTVITKGNDVVDISPEGTYHPFYDREHYRGSTQTRNASRYYPD